MEQKNIPPSSKPQPIVYDIPTQKTRMVKRLLLIGGVGFYFGSMYGIWLWLERAKEELRKVELGIDDPSLNNNNNSNSNNNSTTRFDPTASLLHQLDSQLVYNTKATSYDSVIGKDEFWMGMRLLRRLLLTQAKGDVLEVSAGTSRNTNYYDPTRVRSLVLIDQSPKMLEEASNKVKAFLGNGPADATSSNSNSGWKSAKRVSFQQMDAEKMAFSDNSFDTGIPSLNEYTYLLH